MFFSPKTGQANRGFTLVELLVVVIIVAVIASIALPIFINSRGDAELSTTKNTLVEIGKVARIAIATGAISPSETSPIVGPSTISSSGNEMVLPAGYTLNFDLAAGTFCIDSTASNPTWFLSSTTGSPQQGNCTDGPGANATPTPTPTASQSGSGLTMNGDNATITGTGTFTDTTNGTTITTADAYAAFSSLPANWEYVRLVYQGNTYQVYKTGGITTSGPLTRNSTTSVTINLAKGTAFTAAIKYNGKTAEVNYSFS